MKEKILGIIGGMGPEATVEFMKRVIQATPAENEEDHIRMLVDNNPKVPSRMKALIEGTGESPGPHLAKMARELETTGADLLAVPCNTAHFYFAEIASAVKIPVLNMIDLSIEDVLRNQPEIKMIGILASTAVLKTALYDQGFKQRGVGLISPSALQQEKVLQAIKEIKIGRYGKEVYEALGSAVKEMIDRGAEGILIACTEISVVAHRLHAGVPFVDSLQVLAEQIVRESKGTEI